MKYKHIIWDWNGTLLDDCMICVESFNRSLLNHGLSEISYEDYRSIFTFPVIKSYERLGFNFEMESFQKISDEYVKFYEKNFKNLLLHDHVEEILKSVNLLGSSQSILSAGNQELLNNWLKSHDISQYFLHIIGVENHYANGKIKQGLRLKENLEFKNNEIVLVGDTIHDSEVAEEMGIDCILVDHGHVNTQRLIKTGRIVQSSIRSVLELIN